MLRICELCNKPIGKRNSNFVEKQGLFYHKGCYSNIDLKTEADSPYGIYGIYIEEELVYIGLTTRAFQTRWSEHYEGMSNLNDSKLLYRVMRDAKGEGKQITAKPIIEFRKNSKVSKKELYAMEYSLISVFKPRANVEGVLVNYRDFRANY